MYITYENKRALKSKAESCDTYIKQLKSTLKSLQSKIPDVIRRIQSIQEEIDLHHDNVNKATIAGATAGIVGGGLMIGGLIAAPFTFGASLGLTIVGATIGTAGGVTTAGAKIFDHVQSSDNNDAVKKLLDTVESLCLKAQDQYKKLERCCCEIGHILASNNASLHATTNEEKFKLGWNVVSILSAPPQLGVTIIAVSGALHFGETAAATAVRALAIAVGGIFVGLGILADVYCLGKSIKELATDAKCPVSEAISDQIASLRDMKANITQFLKSLDQLT